MTFSSGLSNVKQHPKTRRPTATALMCLVTNRNGCMAKQIYTIYSMYRKLFYFYKKKFENIILFFFASKKYIFKIFLLFFKYTVKFHLQKKKLCKYCFYISVFASSFFFLCWIFTALSSVFSFLICFNFFTFFCRYFTD